jgi:XTP/dITP diphosphohydrolase
VSAARPTLVIATGNAGKLREFEALLADLPVALRSLREFPGVVLPEEGDDYLVNAAAKARAAAEQTGLPALGDDSGLEVAGLGGAPGARSARYGGPGLDDAGRVAHLLRALGGMQGDARRARFVCVAALAQPDGTLAHAHGSCDGHILESPRGSRGFGYDPVFWSDDLGCGIAEADDARKHAVSHRGRALRALRPALERALLGGVRPSCG